MKPAKPNAKPRKAAGPKDHSKPEKELVIVTGISGAVSYTHLDVYKRQHVLYTNPAFTEIFGYTGEEASGASLTELIVPETRRHEVAMLEKEVDIEGRLATETVRMNKAGELIDVSLVAGPLRVDGGKVGYVLSFRDIGERKERELSLIHI